MVSKIFFLLLIFSLITINSFGQTSELLKTFPTCSPEQQGISSVVLDSLLLFIKNTNQNIHHLTIIRNKQTVLDVDIYPYSSKYVHDLASVTKSIVSLLIGISIDKGYIKDENEPVLKFFPEIKHYDRQLDSLTIKDLITMRSGFDCSLKDGEKALRDMRKTNDWVNFIFNLPITTKPGDTFSYCSCNFYLLGEIIYRATKLIPSDFAKKYLFGPLQIEGTKWSTNYKGMNNGWGDLFLYPADMAKIGQLVLNQGRWQEKQIISKPWLKKSVTAISKFQDGKGYGYGWWTNDKVGGYYEAVGRGEQIISIIPSKNMVVTMLGGEFDEAMIGKYIFESLKSDKPLVNNYKGLSKLLTTIKVIGSKPSFKAIATNMSLIRQLDKRKIVFEKNITDIDSLQLYFFSKEKGAVIFYKKGIGEKYPFLLSTNNYALSFDSTLQLPVALQACFINENEFVLNLNQLGKINNLYFNFILNGNNLTTTLKEISNDIKVDIRSSLK